MQTLKSLTIVLPLAMTLCACGSTSQTKTNMTEADKIADCERRMQAAVRSSESTNSDDPKSVLDKQNLQPPNMRFGNKNNPCRKQEPSIVNKVAESEEEARAIAKTKATIALQNNDPFRAFRSLQMAFRRDSPEDAELKLLAEKIQTAYAPPRTEYLKSLSKPIKSTGGCFFSKNAFSELTKPKIVFDSNTTAVHIRCVPPRPTTLEAASTKATLIIEQRVKTDKYEKIFTKDLGFLSELTKDGAPIDVIWTIPKSTAKRSFLSVTLVLKDAQNNTASSGYSGLFWFNLNAQ